MDLITLIEGIRLPAEAAKQVLSRQTDREEFNYQERLFMENEQSFLEMLSLREDRSEWTLLFYLNVACTAYDKYLERDIPERIYYDTMSDITVWCRDCYKKKGIYGLDEAMWVARSLKLDLFRLGRLQFEPFGTSEAISEGDKTWPPGTEALNVHIPEGGPLDPDLCRESFMQAHSFFGEGPELFICDSWLLDPALRQILPGTSNIIRFQDMFNVFRVHYSFPQAEERIFGQASEDKTSYPEDTYLQREAKRYLLSGKELGIGVGYKQY